MSLRNALLALLSVEPMTGYELAKRFGTTVGNVWHAPDSQIYPELRRMAQDGLLVADEVPWGNKRRRIEYTITDAGRQAFRDWMDSDLQLSRDRDPMHLRAAYFEYATPDRARDQLRVYLEHTRWVQAMWQGQIEEIEAGTSELLSLRQSTLSPRDQRRAAAFKRYTYEGMVARAEAEISWARRGLELLDELDELDNPADLDGPDGPARADVGQPPT